MDNFVKDIKINVFERSIINSKIEMLSGDKFLPEVEFMECMKDLKVTKEDVKKEIPMRFKFLFVGDSKVGKTSLISFLCDQVVKHTYTKTLGCDMRRKNMKLGTLDVNVKLFDLGVVNDEEIERNLPVIIEYFNLAHACIYVADSSEIKSIRKIQQYSSLNRTKSNLKILLLNKSDIESINKLTSHSKLIIQISKELGINAIYETSIMNGESITNWFTPLIDTLIAYYKDNPVYDEKNNIDEGTLFFKYKKAKTKKGGACCW
jgi:GTPase SAR1 family protein